MWFVTGPHARTPRTHSQWVVGPSCTPQGRAVGCGRAPNPGRPTHRQGAPPLGALVGPPQRAKPAGKSARWGVADGSPRPQPPLPQPVGSGPGPHAPRTGSRALESAETGTPRTQARGAPRAPSCRPHNAQSQPARARAVGLMTGPHARTARTHSQWVVGSSCTPQGRAVGWGRAPNPGRRTHRQAAPPSGALVPSPQRENPAGKSARCGVGDGSPRPHPPHPQPVGSGPQPHAPRTGGRSVGERPTRTPHLRQEAPPPGRPPAAPTAREDSSQERAL